MHLLSRVRIITLVSAACLASCTPFSQVASEPEATAAPSSTAEFTPTRVPMTAASVPSPEVTRSAATAAATSRGPDLEATDPESVQLAGGHLQLVEFFRFT